MASPNSWTLPGNGFLGGMNLGPSSLDDPNSEPENPWAKALREAIERQPPSEALRLGTVDEQIRASANSGNPLARPTQALIDWWRRPPAPPQMPQKRTIGPAPYYALDFDDMYPSARIGRAFINHYADYFDPWTYDEQGAPRGRHARSLYAERGRETGADPEAGMVAARRHRRHGLEFCRGGSPGQYGQGGNGWRKGSLRHFEGCGCRSRDGWQAAQCGPRRPACRTRWRTRGRSWRWRSWQSSLGYGRVKRISSRRWCRRNHLSKWRHSSE